MAQILFELKKNAAEANGYFVATESGLAKQRCVAGFDAEMTRRPVYGIRCAKMLLFLVSRASGFPNQTNQEQELTDAPARINSETRVS